MLSPLALVAALLLCTPGRASPASAVSDVALAPRDNPLCKLPLLQKIFCTASGASKSYVVTPLGLATGVEDAGAFRFAVRYASPSRWEASAVTTKWALPNGATDPAALPLICPQDGFDPSAYSEDCLSLLLYVPKGVKLGSNVPTLVWIHGGSFNTGSATGPGLDGSNLAVATDAIVAVIQYRLGGLGFMPPAGGNNLALHDTVVALQFLEKVLPSFGGAGGKVTIAGQSSGASIVRALLGVPSAASLFQNAILQSDPMDYGFLTPAVQNTLQTYFNTQIPCKASDQRCLSALPLATILNATDQLFLNGPGLDPSATQAEPVRPVRDGSLLTNPVDATAPLPADAHAKPVLFTTVRDESTMTIYSAFTDPLPAYAFAPTVELFFDAGRAAAIVDSKYYAMPNNTDFDARTTLETLGTDWVWRCATWTLARLWARAGGKAYVGQYVVGASYPGNEAVPECEAPGVVCHQDDIEIVFGTVPTPSPAQAALTAEIQARYAAFLRTGNPNPSSHGHGYAQWASASTGAVPSLQLGGAGLTPVGACDAGFWGVNPQYDYQVFGQ